MILKPVKTAEQCRREAKAATLKLKRRIQQDKAAEPLVQSLANKLALALEVKGR